MKLTEVVKSFLRQPEEDDNSSSKVDKDNVLIDMTNDELYPNTGAFFDNDNATLFGKSNIANLIFKQKDKIQTYRKLAATPDVNEAIDEIVNEIIFSYEDKIPIMINVNLDNKKLVNAINLSFKKIVKLTNIRRNIFRLVKNAYVDGLVVIHCAYDKKNTKNGFKSIKAIEPCMLYFDARSNTYKYMTEHTSSIMKKDVEEEFSIEEIVREDFGLYDDKINLSYLEYAIKSANMLKTLEDLLIPMRFSRSISRRVFNVDIGDLPTKRGTEVMREYQNKFKYKKFYDNETGEVSNQQHITSMVEDYWFANRSGGKGTQVDLLDETGNLGELNDILYFSKKLYRSMKIPGSRINIDPEADHEFDYDSTRVTKDDLKFFMFISRLRQVYSSLFKEILKREVVSTGILKEQEWETYEEEIEITFVKENSFIEKMNLNNFESSMTLYETALQYQGKIFSANSLLKKIFGYSDEDIEEELNKVQEEKKNKLYADFYKSEDEEEGW